MSTARVPLGEFMPTKKRSLDPRKNPNEEFELFSIPAFDAKAPEIVRGQDVGSSKQMLERGDVLLSRIVPHIRRAWVVEPVSDRPTIGSSEWIIFRNDRFDPAYLRHVLVSDRFHQDFMQTVAGVGGSLLRARPSYVADIKIPLPPIEEQRRIAVVLDAAEALRAKRRLALVRLDSLTQAIFIDMFGDPVSNSYGWPRVPLGELLASATYGTSRKAGAGGRFSVLRMGNLTVEGHLDLGDMKFLDLDEREVDRHTVRKGDVLFNRTNSADLVGKTAVYRLDECMAYAGYLVRLRPKRSLNSEYLGTFMNLPTTKLLLRGMCKSIVGMANINAREVQTVRLPLPPQDRQAAFSAAQADVAQQRVRLERQLISLDTLFASLQHRAFRGEL